MKKPIALLVGLMATAPLAAQDQATGDATIPQYSAAATYAEAAAAVDPVGVAAIVTGEGAASPSAWACASCHGTTGQGKQTVPRLAGLPAGYITKQLHDYRNGTRRNGTMQYVVSTLDDEQMAALGAYYAVLDAPPTAEPSLGGDLERGRALALQGDWSVALPSCFSCHGALGWGVEEAFPGIAGQHPAYIHAQLAAWKNGARANSPLGLMQSVAAAMSPRDMRAVSDFLATLPPPQPRYPEQ